MHFTLRCLLGSFLIPAENLFPDDNSICKLEIARANYSKVLETRVLVENWLGKCRRIKYRINTVVLVLFLLWANPRQPILFNPVLKKTPQEHDIYGSQSFAEFSLEFFTRTRGQNTQYLSKTANKSRRINKEIALDIGRQKIGKSAKHKLRLHRHFLHLVLSNQTDKSFNNPVLWIKIRIRSDRYHLAGSDRQDPGCRSGSVSILTKCKAKLYFLSKISIQYSVPDI